MTIDSKLIIGAVYLGIATGSMLLVMGRVLGCSGILFNSWDFFKKQFHTGNCFFLLGLFLSGLIFNLTQTVPNPFMIFKTSLPLIFLGGFLVGSGTYLGSGCTSGHGLCGMALLRKRSIIAVALFFPVAIITAWLVH